MLKNDDLIKKLLEYIKNQVSDERSRDNLNKLLDIFTLMIDNTEKVKEIQDLFNKNNAINVILSILSSSGYIDDELIVSILKFINGLLKDRNSNTQRTIMNYFSTFRQSENIFKRIDQILGRWIEYLKEEKKSQRNKYEEEQCKLILRFIQLCTEGHYLELQNYFRKQVNSKKNYNILKLLIDLAIEDFKSSKTLGNESLLYCIDTLIELIQGPCSSNQNFVLDSNLLEYLANMIDYGYHINVESNRRKNKGKRGTQRRAPIRDMSLQNSISVRFKFDEGNTKSNSANQRRYLRYKVSILFRSLLEVNSNPQLRYERMAKYLRFNSLMFNIIEVYKGYEAVFGDKLLSEAMNKYEFNRSSLGLYNPIEAGFNLYFIMRNILRFSEIYQGKLLTYTEERIKEKEVEIRSSKIFTNEGWFVVRVMYFIISIFMTIYKFLGLIFCSCDTCFSNSSNKPCNPRKK